MSTVGGKGRAVTATQETPTRNSSHCMAAGTLAAVFCRMLNRSIVYPSVPVVAEMKPEFGSEASVEGSGLIQSETGLGEAVKSYLPTRKTVSPAWNSRGSKVMVAPLPLFCTPMV